MGKVLKSWMMLFAISFALAGTATLSSCSSDDDPFFTVSEDDDPRILNTDLADQTLDRKTKLNLEIKVTPVHYTTVTWLLDDTQIAEGTTIDQTLPVGNHTLKIVATTTKGKSTSRTLNVTVTPAADDPALGTNAIELWVAPGAETTIHNCKNLGTVTKVMVGGKKVAFEILEEGTAMKLTAPADLENGDYAITLVDGEGNQFPGGWRTSVRSVEDRANLIARKDRIGLVLVDIEHTVLVVGTKKVGHQFHHLTYLFLQGEFLQGLFYLSLNLRVALDNWNIGTGCISQCQH